MPEFRLLPLPTPRLLRILKAEAYDLPPCCHDGFAANVEVHPDGRVFIGTYDNTARIVLDSAYELDYQLHHAMERARRHG